MDTGTAYLQHLTDSDLALLAEPASAAAALRTEPTLLDAVLRSPRSFERVFGATESATVADVSPFLVFAVAVHRALDDLGDTRFVDERVGPRMRVPVFDAPQLAEFATDPTRRYFVVEHLTSYTRVISGPMWVQRNNRWRKQRFSELDAPRLAQMVQAVPESDRPGLYRRLGDLALFLTGVFPDHTARRQLGPVELERLLRSLPPGAAGRASLADIADLAGDRGATGVFEWLGPRWYALAAARTPLAALSRTLGEISQRFDQARRFLNHLTDRYLLPGAHTLVPRARDVSAPLVERITARESERDQRRVAGSLRGRGLGAGDRVALVAGPSATYLAAVLGALRSGIVPVLLNPALTEREAGALLADAEPAVVLRAADLPGLLDGPDADLAPVPLARPMMYTSGTTGTPKGVWSGVLDEAGATALVRDEQEVWGFARDDVLLVLSPLHHSAPIRFATGTLLAGGEVVLATPFDAARVAGAIANERPTLAFATPAHLQRLFDLPDLPALDSFRLLAHAGAPCAHAVKRRALDAFPSGSVWEFYGSTEGQFTACSSDEWLDRPGTVGRARPGRELVVESAGDEEQGIVWCRVPPFARFEYWRDPVKTAAAWEGDAFTVRDVGRLDADGYLYLDGRRDDLIISGGVNVYPLEVERVILEHPGVRDTAVFGVADERWGQRVCAAVVGDVDPEALDEFLRVRLARYKHPKTILRVDDIPVSATGKVRRHELAAALGV